MPDLSDEEKKKLDEMVQLSAKSLTDVEKGFVLELASNCMAKIWRMMPQFPPDVVTHQLFEVIRVQIFQTYMTGKAVGKGDLEV